MNFFFNKIIIVCVFSHKISEYEKLAAAPETEVDKHFFRGVDFNFPTGSKSS